MRAVVVREFGGPDVLGIEQVPDPVPTADQVLVRVHAAGVNPVDVYIQTGRYPSVPSLPYIPGKDGAGIVEAVGANVDKRSEETGSGNPTGRYNTVRGSAPRGIDGFAIGDRVFFSGADTIGSYAELVACDPTRMFPLAAQLSFAQGAAIGIPYATAYRALFHKARAAAGEWLLVHGASGAVGLAAVQLAVAAGLRVIGTAGSDAGRRLVHDQGARHVLDHGAAGYLDAIEPLTRGHGVDVIVESSADVNLPRDLEVVARGGRVVVVGNRGPVELNLRAAMMRDAEILPIALANTNARDYASINAGLVAGFDNGTLRPIVAAEFPLGEAPRAHRDVMASKARGKIVLVP